MTVTARRIIATPARSAADAWQVIVDLLAPQPSPARNELLRIHGIASSLIASLAMQDAPIIVYGNGPRVRIYCVYDDDAISGEGASEQALATCPTDGDWALSLPAPAEDLDWLTAALSARSTKITARDQTEPVSTQSGGGEDRKASAATIDLEAFLRP